MSHINRPDVKKCFHESFVNKNFDYFQRFRLANKWLLVAWLFLAALLFVGLVAIGGRSLRASAQVTELEQESRSLLEQLSTIKIKIKDVKIEVQKKDTVVEQLVSFFNNLFYIIPAQSWLERITYSEGRSLSNESSGRGGKMELVGSSPNCEEILSFYAEITKQEPLEKCLLQYEKRGERLIFVINAQLC